MMAARLKQILFCVSLVGLSWLTMLATHELGHVVGAWASGGSVRKVVLHPLTISRTDVAPNPHPGFVVWAGPILGCAIPLMSLAVAGRRPSFASKLVTFVVGFCLVGNGAYIAIGSLEQIGDCKTMLQTGSPYWTLMAFGVFAIGAGIFVWHRLGSVIQFLQDEKRVSPGLALGLSTVFGVVLIAEMLFSPM